LRIFGKVNPRVYYNSAGKNEASNFAQLFIRLEEMELPEIQAFVEDLRNGFTGIRGARIEAKQFEQGPPVEAPVAIRVFGEILDSLRGLAGKVTQQMKLTKGTIYISNPFEIYKTDIRVKINKEKAALYGIPTVEIDRTIRMGIAGLNASVYKDAAGEDYAVNVTIAHSGNQTLDAFNHLYVSAPTGKLIPVKQLATLEFETSVPTIGHFDTNRYVTVTSFVKPGFSKGEVTNELLGRHEYPQRAGNSYVI